MNYIPYIYLASGSSKNATADAASIPSGTIFERLTAEAEKIKLENELRQKLREQELLKDVTFAPSMNPKSEVIANNRNRSSSIMNNSLDGISNKSFEGSLDKTTTISTPIMKSQNGNTTNSTINTINKKSILLTPKSIAAAKATTSSVNNTSPRYNTTKSTPIIKTINTSTTTAAVVTPSISQDNNILLSSQKRTTQGISPRKSIITTTPASPRHATATVNSAGPPRSPGPKSFRKDPPKATSTPTTSASLTPSTNKKSTTKDSTTTPRDQVKNDLFATIQASTAELIDDSSTHSNNGNGHNSHIKKSLHKDTNKTVSGIITNSPTALTGATLTPSKQSSLLSNQKRITPSTTTTTTTPSAAAVPVTNSSATPPPASQSPMSMSGSSSPDIPTIRGGRKKHVDNNNTNTTTSEGILTDDTTDNTLTTPTDNNDNTFSKLADDLKEFESSITTSNSVSPDSGVTGIALLNEDTNEEPESY